MYGGISLIGWFHTIVGIGGILTGIYLLVRYKSINIWSSLGMFYIICTLLASGSSFFIFSATGSFNDAHVLSLLTILAIIAAFILDRFNLFGFLTTYFKELALSVTILFSMLPTTAEVLKRLPPNDPFVDSIYDPLIMNFYMSYAVIYAIFALYQIFLIKGGLHNEK
ncbi:MAG: hypothetical protein ACJ0FW_01770 [Gammaproteobacteria bacterium]|tara:strand:- start:6459 stop:6959 length:501 start_codon:yes stop_codon:yes gene_type:complete